MPILRVSSFSPCVGEYDESGSFFISQRADPDLENLEVVDPRGAGEMEISEILKSLDLGRLGEIFEYATLKQLRRLARSCDDPDLRNFLQSKVRTVLVRASRTGASLFDPEDQEEEDD